jgi:hypothetical protein
MAHDYQHRISTLYGEFTDALTEVLSENAVGPSRRGRLARSRAAIKKHTDCSEHGYFLGVEAAFKQWETMQNIGHSDRPSQLEQNDVDKGANGSDYQ